MEERFLYYIAAGFLVLYLTTPYPEVVFHSKKIN